MMLKFLALQGASYIYDISRLKVKQRILPNCLPQDLEIVSENGGESISRYCTPRAIAKFTGKRKKIQSGYFIATPRNLLGLIT
jgi:hypothetical protein